MNWVGALLGGLGCSSASASDCGLAALLRRRAPADAGRVATVPDAPAVPDGTPEVLKVIRSAGVVVGPHDEVLESTPLAQTLG